MEIEKVNRVAKLHEEMVNLKELKTYLDGGAALWLATYDNDYELNGKRRILQVPNKCEPYLLGFLKKHKKMIQEEIDERINEIKSEFDIL